MGAQALSQKRQGVPVFGTSRVRVMHPSACRRSATPRSGWEEKVKPRAQTRRGNEVGVPNGRCIVTAKLEFRLARSDPVHHGLFDIVNVR